MKPSIIHLSLLLSLAPMTATDLVCGLHEYVLLLAELEAREESFNKAKGESTIAFSNEVSLSYSFIDMELYITTLKGERKQKVLYMKCEFEIGEKNVGVKNVYCEDKARELEIKNHILLHTPGAFPTKSIMDYGEEILRYLSIADEIARQAYLCSSGDDYRPGYFSEIIIDDAMITLRQINRHNSRSINHKSDYHMRDLEFFIPLTEAEQKLSFQDEHIGKMLIRFSDTSSKNNRTCGDKIREKIDEERLKFELALK